MRGRWKIHHNFGKFFLKLKKKKINLKSLSRFRHFWKKSHYEYIQLSLGKFMQKIKKFLEPLNFW